jgi:hypothetical protein
MAKTNIVEISKEMLTEISLDAGNGMETITADDLAIPFLVILQSGSPQCKKSDGAYIKGAEEGMIYNTVSNEVADGDTGINVIPVSYQRKFVEWRPREEGGGLVNQYEPGDPILSGIQSHDGKDFLPSGNNIVQTAYHYVVAVINDKPVQAVITMSSTQLKKSRRWNSMIVSRRETINNAVITPPTYGQVYLLKTVPESNDRGTWFGWAIESAGLVSDITIYNEAKAFNGSVGSGLVKVSAPTSVEETSLI